MILQEYCTLPAGTLISGLKICDETPLEIVWTPSIDGWDLTPPVIKYHKPHSLQAATVRVYSELVMDKLESLYAVDGFALYSQLQEKEFKDLNEDPAGISFMEIDHNFELYTIRSAKLSTVGVILGQHIALGTRGNLFLSKFLTRNKPEWLLFGIHANQDVEIF